MPNTITMQMIISCLILLLSISCAAEPYDIPADADGLNIRPHIKLFTDYKNQYPNLKELLQGDIKYIDLNDEPKSISKYRHWIKLELHNPDTKAHNWYMKLDSPGRKFYIHAYWLKNGTINSITRLDKYSSFSKRAVDDPLIFLPIFINANESKTFFLHYEMPNNLPLSFGLFSHEEYKNYRNKTDNINILFIGFISAVFIMTFMHWVLNPVRIYFYYLALIFFIILLISQLSGYSFKYFWPNNAYFATLSVRTVAAFLSIFYLLFIRQFLYLDKLHPMLNKIFLCFIFMFFMLILFIPFSDVLQFILTAMVMLIPVLLYTAYWSFKQDYSAAKLLSLSIVSHVLFINALMMGKYFGFDLLPKIEFQMYPKIGYTLEVIFFNIILSLKNRELRKNHTKNLIDRIREAEKLALLEKENSRILSDTQSKILQFAAATHDIAQPLSSVRMALGAIPDGVDIKVKRHIDKTVEYAEQLLRTIIRDSKSDYIELKSDVLLSDVFQQVIERHEHLVDEKRIELCYFSSQRLIKASPQSLLRILDNLIVNAIRYTKSGRVFLGVRQKNNCLEIQVWDTGTGIHKHAINRLLEPFEQGHQFDTKKQGHGLGLNIVKVLCNKCGYTLSINSALDKGSCFSISISTMSSNSI